MSIEVPRYDLIQVLSHLQKLLELLVYPKLNALKIEQIKSHMTALRLDPKLKDVQFELSADERGNTTFICKILVKELTQ